MLDAAAEAKGVRVEYVPGPQHESPPPNASDGGAVAGAAAGGGDPVNSGNAVAAENKALAAAALRVLGPVLGCDESGLDLGFWPCRFEVLQVGGEAGSTVVIDGAHNDDG